MNNMHKYPENAQKITAKSPPAPKTAPNPFRTHTLHRTTEPHRDLANNPNNPNKTHAEAQRPHGVLNIAHRDYPPHSIYPLHKPHSSHALDLFSFGGQESCSSAY